MKKWFWIVGFAATAVILVVALAILVLAAGKFSGGAASSGGGGGNGSVRSSNNVPNVPPNPADQTTPTPTLLATILGGPYLVKQTVHLGDETLQSPPGGVCTNSIWHVPSVTPKVSFTFIFDAYNANTGISGNRVTYSYSIPSAGESHQAQGSYTLTSNQDGSLTVSLNVRDHVVFKGFDGTIPLNYHFDLVPMDGNATCGG